MNPQELLLHRPVPFLQERRLDEDIASLVEGLLDAATLQRVPSLNDCAAEQIPDNALVKFRCIVQDQFDPEYYLGAYLEMNTATRETVYPAFYSFFF